MHSLPAVYSVYYVLSCSLCIEKSMRAVSEVPSETAAKATPSSSSSQTTSVGGMTDSHLDYCITHFEIHVIPQENYNWQLRISASVDDQPSLCDKYLNKKVEFYYTECKLSICAVSSPINYTTVSILC